MRQTVLERRVELLRMEGSGFSTNEIVNYLSEKYHVCERQVYYDYERRKTWQTLIQQLADPDKFLLKIINRYEQIYQKASLLQLQADNDNAKIGALRTMLEANHMLHLSVMPTAIGLEPNRGEPTPEPLDLDVLTDEEKKILTEAAHIYFKHRNEKRKESIHGNPIHGEGSL